MLLEDSTTYQWILQKGVSQGLSEGLSQGVREGERNVLLRQGTKRFGPPSAAALAELQSISDTERLEQLAEKLLDATSWDDLLFGK